MQINLLRFLAGYIDYAVCFGIAFYTAALTSYGEVRLSSFSINLGVVVFFIVVLFKDAVFKNASIGKKILKLEIQCNKGKFGFICMLKRTICLFFLLGIEIILVILGKRTIGDRWAHCDVVARKK